MVASHQHTTSVLLSIGAIGKVAHPKPQSLACIAAEQEESLPSPSPRNGEKLLESFKGNRIRPLKLTAKNALFAGHDEGARSWGRVGSLIETCKMNGVEPYAWLKSTLAKIAAGHPNSRIDELLPWNFDGPSS